MVTLKRANFTAYHGTLLDGPDARMGLCDALLAKPSASHHMRFVSNDLYQGVYATFLLWPVRYTRPTPKNDDGLHFRYEINNEYGYTLQMVRRDGKTKLAREDGPHEYDDIHYPPRGLPLTLGTAYICEVRATADHVWWSVQSHNDEFTAEADVLPFHVDDASSFRQTFPFGRVGFRFDGLEVCLTFPVVRGL